jgi:lambda repressor-like predicted transcriptional regulator
MISKNDLKTLIKAIKEKTGQTQEEISINAGYKEKTLTQLLSKGENLDSAYIQLKLAYNKELNNSTLDSELATKWPVLLKQTTYSGLLTSW